MPSVTITSSASGTATTSTTPAGSASSSSTLQPSNHRRKKPKRRSTGVVNLDVDVRIFFSKKKKIEKKKRIGKKEHCRCYVFYAWPDQKVVNFFPIFFFGLEPQ